MRKPYIIALVLLSVALTLFAAAPPFTRTAGSPYNSPHFPDPPEFCSIIKQSVEGDTGGAGAGNTDFVFHFGQQFTPSSNYTVCKIQLKCGFKGTPGTNGVIVSLYDYDPTSNGIPGLILASSPFKSAINLPVVTTPLTNDVDVPWTKFDIPPTSLVSGTTYWVVAFEAKAGIFDDNYFVWYVEGGAINVVNNSVNSYDNALQATLWVNYNNNTRFKFRLMGQEPL